jgi:hypothetical protein
MAAKLVSGDVDQLTDQFSVGDPCRRLLFRADQFRTAARGVDGSKRKAGDLMGNESDSALAPTLVPAHASTRNVDGGSPARKTYPSVNQTESA